MLIRRSKGDQEGQGQEVAIPRGYKLRPIEALQAWLTAAEINAGPVFQPVLKDQRVQAVMLSAFSAAQMTAARSRWSARDGPRGEPIGCRVYGRLSAHLARQFATGG